MKPDVSFFSFPANILPFLAIEGCGENAANSLYEAIQNGDFISIEDIRSKASINGTVMDKLEEMGVFGDLPKTAQISLFDF